MAAALAMVACCAAAGWGTYAVALQHYVTVRAEETGQCTTSHAQNLRSTLARYESSPRLTALEYVLHAALQENPHAGDTITRRAASAYLKKVRAATDLAATHLINTTGLTITTSNQDLPTSFVGQNYAFHPYFVKTICEGLDRFYSVGNATGETGCFITAPVCEDNKPIGVVVVKVDLDAFEATLSRGGDTVLLVDRHSVVFLPSVPEWKYRTLDALNVDQYVAFGATRQYTPHILTPLDINDGRAASISLSADHSPQTARVILPGKSVLTLRVQCRPVGLLGWQVAVLIDLHDEQRAALAARASVAFAVTLIFAVLVALRLCQRRCEEQHRTRAALREVRRGLGARIAQRTVELTSINTALAGKAEALDAAQHILYETRDTAVQAGKLATLGQVATGITYELNQPFTALTTLSDNANQLAERGRVDGVHSNLTHTSQLVEYMGRIVSHIKTSSRKGDVACAAMSVDEAIRQALMLAETRRRQADVAVIADPVSADLAVWANAVRLEQVLISLVRSAIGIAAEASAVESSTVRVSVEPIEKWVHIIVRDLGPGIPTDVLPHLFEPFFTTRGDGQGLELGLVISLAIIEDFGDRLEGRNTGGDVSGVEFTIEFEHAVKPT